MARSDLGSQGSTLGGENQNANGRIKKRKPYLIYLTILMEIPMKMIFDKRTKIILSALLATGLIVFGILIRPASPPAPTPDSLQSTLQDAGSAGRVIIDSLSSTSGVSLRRTNSGFEAKDDGQADFKIDFPTNYGNPIAVTLAEGKTITITDQSAKSAEGILLTDQASGHSTSLRYGMDDRKTVYYSYQKYDSGERKLKNWVLYATGTGNEFESYRFENAKIVLDSQTGNAYVSYRGSSTAILPLQIPRPFIIDKNGNRTDLDWNLNDTADTLSIHFTVAPDAYPVVLDPTVVPTQFTIEGAVTMKGAVRLVTDGSRTADVAQSPYTPINTAIPPLFGTTATVGETVSTAPGVWSGNPTATYAYQWKRSGTNISGATGTSYVIQAADAGSTLSVTVTATNSAGSASATSKSTGAVGGLATPTVEYLVVAGGGGGGGAIASYFNGSGGGAGGMLTGSTAISVGNAYTISVGSGGTAGPATSSPSGGNGGNSSFGTVTATGGGGGAGGNGSANNGNAGGSGGGGRALGAIGGTGIAGQGNKGGDSLVAGSAGAGGGGAGAAAANVVTTGVATAGGVGLQSSITGTATYYAGGGGGGGTSVVYNAAGGLGGGGAAGVAGTANTGGGGGGLAYATAAGTGAAGGSGIVIIRYPNTYADATSTTGSPTYANTGGYKIYTWTTVGSGSVTFSAGVGPAIVNPLLLNGQSSAQAGASCASILAGGYSVGDGTYWIKPASYGGSPFQAYCDMTTDGGGYTYYAISSGLTTYKSTDNNSCKALGMDIVIPRTQAHFTALYAKYGASYFATVPGVYGTVPGNYTNCSMRNPTSYGSGCSNWYALDGGKWWLRDSAYSQPDGNYTAYCWLAMGSWATPVISSLSFDDWNCNYSTSSYICSTNDK
ncbi:MAG: glycine-rich domain-containing protein [Candidatus Moraniibacteriota bacterium]